ncbi:MAG: hypothetical protein V1900_02145 [Candidatus Aenigmatarchaeota archaeon]
MAEKLNPKVLAATFAIIALIFDLVAYIWHGLLKEPSVMNLVYPSFWTNWSLMIYALVSCLVFSYIFGYVFACVYNWAAKKFK